ncbi:MAG TPA: GH92 family glycosyl hydrolase [Actinokineospora sp.]|nr:GH92 family glycosyl hydrolase [Actinokineospora sp.]
MKLKLARLLVPTAVVAALVGYVPPQLAAAAVPADLTTLVNPFIGTRNHGNTFPGASMPFGMVQLSPDTGWGMGYNYDHTRVTGFSHTHLSGVGCAAATEVSLMPTIGAVTSNNPSTYGQTLDHTKEVASPGYYKIATPNGVTTELTATMRTGWQKYTFPATTQANVLFNSAATRGGTAANSSTTIVGNDTVEGSVTIGGFCGGTTQPQHTVYFSAKFSRPFASSGTWSGTTFTPGGTSSTGSGARGGWVRFDTSTSREVTVKTGLSYTGLAGARANLTAETGTSFDFTAKKTAAHDTWNTKLHKIEVDGGTTDRQTAFYTSLYHSLLHPNVASDTDGKYMGFDRVTHTATGYTQYQTFSLWDTFRSQNQLIALLEPQAARDMGISLLSINKELGWLPRWTMYNTETNVMTGDPVTPFLVDLWSRGLLGGYEEEAYTALWNNVNNVPAASLGINGRHGNPTYKSLGYVSANTACTPIHVPDWDCEFPGSVTLEYAAADSALAIMAAGLGKTADAATLRARGQSYRNIYDASVGLYRPRLADGSWLTPFNTTSGEIKFQESGPHQYQWLVPQDTAGLVGMLGGATATNTKLDKFFAYSKLLTDPETTARTDWVNAAYSYYTFETYNPNNEPDLLAPYTYLWTGQPHKTSTVVRAAFTLFTNAANGVTGNDDLGTMSAWYVLSSLGIYPLMNGANYYGVTTPQFPYAKMTIGSYGTTQGGTLTINAPGTTDTNRYISTARLGGTAFTRTWLSQTDIAKGGTLDYTVSATPSTWGTGTKDVPPSPNSPNLALNRPVTSSAPCATAEGPEKAVNGSVTGGLTDKFCSQAASAWLRVDLGSTKAIKSFVVKHAGAGGESTSNNTRAFNIQTSNDGTTWSTAVTVTANTANVSTHPVTASGRYVRLTVTTPTQTVNPATRIYELEVNG